MCKDRYKNKITHIFIKKYSFIAAGHKEKYIKTRKNMTKIVLNAEHLLRNACLVENNLITLHIANQIDKK